MSKIVAGTALVLLSGATVTGGVLLLPKAFGGVDADLPDTLDKFKQEGHKEGCIGRLFGKDVDFSSSSGTVSEDFKSPFFGGEGKKTEGCLVINWDKKFKASGTTTQWSGSIRFLWAVKGESKGFVVYLSGTTTKDTTNASAHKITWSGAGYLMEKETDSSKWSTKKKVDTKNNAAFPKTETATDKFPTANDVLAVQGNNAELWGFFGGVGEMSNIVNDSELTEPTQSSLRGYWEWEGQHDATETEATDKKKLSDWTKNLDKWWPDIFSSDAFKANAKTAVEGQKGTWTKKKYDPTPTTTPSGTNAQ